MSHKKTTVWIAVPAMDELENLPGFIDAIRHQSWSSLKVFICINQPDSWWDRPEKSTVCRNNQQSIADLSGITGLDMTVLDRSSRGRGWPDKKQGVGWARKTLMDAISREADPDDLILSLDADTHFAPDYLDSVVRNFQAHPQAVALAVPYYHELSGDPVLDRSMLRYEIYMRYYGLNLWRAESPYSFTALGSAIALPVRSYSKIGGITPHPGGEDFYLLQKLVKFGPVLVWNRCKVYPAGRYSDRVGFGTGPAIKQGSAGNWSAYPLYPCEYFDAIKETIKRFEDLYTKPVPTPMDQFLKEKFKEADLWQALRINSRSLKQFVRACHTKIDGLRTLQYLKWRLRSDERNDENALKEWFDRFDPGAAEHLNPGSLSFEHSSIPVLDALRNRLASLEASFQQENILLQL